MRTLIRKDLAPFAYDKWHGADYINFPLRPRAIVAFVADSARTDTVRSRWEKDNAYSTAACRSR